MYSFSTKLNTSGLTISRPELGSITRSKLPLGTKKETTHTMTIIMVRITKTCGILKDRFFFSIAVCAAGARALLSV